MAKDKISDYSSTANSNTDIAGINIDEGCAPSGINDAIRTLMAQLKTWQSGGQDVYIHPAGSASAPSITANGDTNTGIFFPAADTVGISTGGSERARVDSSGNLGLGVTPNTWRTNDKAIQIGGSTDYANIVGTGAGITFGNNFYRDSGGFKYKNSYAAGRFDFDYTAGGGFTWNIAASGTAGNAITFTQAMTLDASGNLGVGTTSPTYPITIERASQSTLEIKSASTTGESRIYFSDTTTAIGAIEYQHNGDYMRFYTNNAERARIDSSGNLLVNTTSTAANAGVGIRLIGAGGLIQGTQAGSTNSTTNLDLYSTGAGAYRFYVGMAGTVFATNTTISAISDIRFKENVRDLNVGLSEVMALKPRLYDWKEGKGADIKNARGFIAQEFEEVFPDLIDEWKEAPPEGEEPYKSVRADLIPVLVKAIQEQQAIITALTARITALEQA
jgi:hypothetical protein